MRVRRISAESVLALALVVAVALAYLTCFNGVFLFDDAVAIFKNPGVVGESAVFSGHRWLVDLSFRINWMISGTAVFSYHAVNLTIHIAAVLFLYGIVRRSVLRYRCSGGGADGRRWARGTAFAIALLWGLHPLSTQAVTYVCQRYESMMGMFMLGSLYCFVRGSEGRHERLWCDASLLLMLLGIGCKEVMAVTPILILAYDYVFCSKSLEALTRKRGLFHVASFLMLLVVLLFELQFAGRLMVIDDPRARVGALSALPYLYTQAQVICHYIYLALWPKDLCFDYAWGAKSYAVSGLFPVVFHVVILLASLVGLIRRKWYGFVGCAFYLILAPTSSVIPVADIAVEHRMYMPLVAVTVMLVMLLRWLSSVLRASSILKNSDPQNIFAVAVLALAVALGVRTSIRNMDYWSELTMWQGVVSKNPNNLRARNDLASSLSERGRVEAAMSEYREVLARIPVHLKNKIDRGEAIVVGTFRQSSPEYAYFVACANMGTMYCNELRDYDAAFDWYLRALRVAPFSPQVRQSSMNLLRAFGHEEQELEEALNNAILESIRERRKE